VTIFDVDHLQKFVQARADQGATITVKHLRELIVEGNEQLLKDMLETPGFRMWKRQINEGECLRVPWGMLLVEKVVNNKDCWGIRWLDVCSSLSPGFSTLLSYMVPSGSVVKSGSTTALLQKVSQCLLMSPNCSDTVAARPTVGLLASASSSKKTAPGVKLVGSAPAPAASIKLERPATSKELEPKLKIGLAGKPTGGD